MCAPVSVQNVWCGWPEVREKEVDPLLRGCDVHHLLRSSQCIRHGAGRGRWSGELRHFYQVGKPETTNTSASKLDLFAFYLFRTACTSPSIYSTVSATTDSLHWPPSCFSSTRRISLKRRSRKSIWVSASQTTMVSSGGSWKNSQGGQFFW